MADGSAARDVKTRSIVVLIVVGAAAIAAAGLWRSPLPGGSAEHGVPNSAASVAPAAASASPNASSTNAADAAAEPRAVDAAWRTPSTPSPRYADPEEIERQLEQFLAEQPGLVVASLSSIHCSATACEIALTGTDPSPRYVGAYSGLSRKLLEGPWTDFRMLYGGISTREVAPGAREYVMGFEYQALVDLSADPLIAARQYAACAAAWRRQTEIGPHPDDEARYYHDQAEHYVALAASVLGEQEAARIAAETRGGPLIRECNPG